VWPIYDRGSPARLGGDRACCYARPAAGRRAPCSGVGVAALSLEAATGRGSAAALSSSLSPFANPFDPVGSTVGRSKSRRWADDDGEETDDDHPMTYLETARVTPSVLRCKSQVKNIHEHYI
jgi:hypothetical protein